MRVQSQHPNQVGWIDHSIIGNEVIRGNFTSVKSIKSQASDFLPLRCFYAHSDFLPLRYFMRIVVIFVIVRLFYGFLCFLFFFLLFTRIKNI